ncbi:MAG: tRNA (cytidine(56)-2'-O)-methyltransferase [archaeon]|jgi:tRNA (cytidine56-2'-O)-methyltransferase
MTQNVYKLTILRLDHRPYRDKRITTHCALVSRAFGANEFYFSGVEDSTIIEVLSKINENWGGDFKIEYTAEPLSFVKKFKENQGIVIHLTMYGLPVLEKIEEIKKEKISKNLLLIVGGSKVPKEYYELADFNIAIGNQPHSEVSALGLILYLIDPDCMNKPFDNSKIKIIPSNTIKKVISL